MCLNLYAKTALCKKIYKSHYEYKETCNVRDTCALKAILHKLVQRLLMPSGMLHYYSVQWTGCLPIVYSLMSRQHSPLAQSTEKHLLSGHRNLCSVSSGTVQMNLYKMEINQKWQRKFCSSIVPLSKPYWPQPHSDPHCHHNPLSYHHN